LQTTVLNLAPKFPLLLDSSTMKASDEMEEYLGERKGQF